MSEVRFKLPLDRADSFIGYLRDHVAWGCEVRVTVDEEDATHITVECVAHVDRHIIAGVASSPRIVE